MSEPHGESHAAAHLDVEVVEKYLAAHIPGFRGPLSFAKTPTGQSNPTFILTAGSGKYVLRRKPPGELLKSAHAVDREYRVQKALQDTDVPTAKMLHLCEDEDVIGSIFYVMECVEGEVHFDPRLPGKSPEVRARMFDQMNAGLAALHNVDYQTVGLGDFGRPGSYFARQFSRWSKQYYAAQTQDWPDMDALIKWVEANMPEDDGITTLVHGDYRLDNIMYAPEGRALAVLDWELATLGHPYSDIAYQCMQWRMPPGLETRGFGDQDRTELGIPSEEAYVALYCERRGLSGIPIFDFCLAFSFFRMAAIVQGVLKRGLDGNASNPEQAKAMGEWVPVFAKKGLEATG
ncbi:MAG: phosphotransferase family protein [Pseudomonadota bacterium]